MIFEVSFAVILIWNGGGRNAGQHVGTVIGYLQILGHPLNVAMQEQRLLTQLLSLESLHIRVQPIHKRCLFDRVQRDGIVDLLAFQLARVGVASARIVTQDVLHLCSKKKVYK